MTLLRRPAYAPSWPQSGAARDSLRGMFSGITFEKLVLIGVIAAIIIGPDRLPRYAESLARFVKRAKEWSTTARTRVKEEMGDDFDDVDWRTLDPRRYDPRRIIREALLDDAPVGEVKPVTAPMAPATSTPPRAASLQAGETPPYDVEAT